MVSEDNNTESEPTFSDGVGCLRRGAAVGGGAITGTVAAGGDGPAGKKAREFNGVSPDMQ